MPKFGPFLPNIKKSIYDILERNELAPDFYFDSDDFYEKLETQRFFIMPVIDKHNDKFIFKARIEDHLSTQAIFDREIRFPQFVKKLNIPFLNVPDVKKAEYKPIEWYIYPYLETDASGNIAEIWEKYQENFPIKKVVLSIIALQENTKNITEREGFVEIPKRSGEGFIELFDQFKNSLDGLISPEETSQAREILLANKDLLKKSSAVLSHGDLHPGNIILNEKDSPPSVTLIDWAGVQINNYAYDIAFLWATLSKSPKIQNDIIEEFKKVLLEHGYNNDDFEKLFNLDLFIIIPQIVDRFNYITEHTGKKFDKQVGFLVEKFGGVVR